MVRDLIISSNFKGVEIALLEDNALVEFHQEHDNNQFAVGDIYLGTVKRTVTGLNAAFVNIGYEKDAFLHYTDLGVNIRSMNSFLQKGIMGEDLSPLLANFEFEAPIIKTGEINEVLQKRQKILVQIIKEPIASKGPRLTSEISLPGRFAVLSPFSNTVSVSKKIKDEEERERLISIAKALLPSGFGLIIRTAAEGKKKGDIKTDIQHLLNQWKKILAELIDIQAPEKVFSEINRTSSILRDLLNASFTKIVANEKAVATDIKQYITQIAPEQAKIVSYYNSRISIFDHYNVTKQIKSSFGKVVAMASGAYLIIEHTEAMTVIDVNSGNKMSNSVDQASAALTVNLEAAAEIARQLRLRDIGGIVVVDFIDIKDAEAKKMVSRRVKECMMPDRARHTILPLSKFCLLQITRQRVKPAIEISTAENCPSCNGTGKIQPTILLIDEIKRNFKYLVQELGFAKLTLTVHPFIDAFFKKGIISEQRRWAWEFKQWVNIDTDKEYALTEYRFHDDLGEEIQL